MFLQDFLPYVMPTSIACGVIAAFLKFGKANLIAALDRRTLAVVQTSTAPLEIKIDAVTASVAGLATAVEEGFKANNEGQTQTNDHLAKLNSKVATQEARTAMLNQRQAYTEGHLGIPLGPMPDQPQDHLAGLAYIEGKKSMPPGELREA